MRIVPVYRMNYITKTKVQIGVVEERRKTERGNNLVGLLRLARNTYAYSLNDAHEIVVGGMVDLAGGARQGTT